LPQNYLVDTLESMAFWWEGALERGRKGPRGKKCRRCRQRIRNQKTRGPINIIKNSVKEGEGRKNVRPSWEGFGQESGLWRKVWAHFKRENTQQGCVLQVSFL